MSDDKNLEKLKEKAEKHYHSIGEIYCPYFKENVSFNREGLKHVKFKRDKEARNRSDQFMRLKNLHLAPTIIKNSHTLQEHRVAKSFIQIKTNTREEKVLKSVTYYCFIAIIQDGNFQKKLKIVVREVEGGKKHFWSIVPAWTNNKELKLHSGNPETD